MKGHFSTQGAICSEIISYISIKRVVGTKKNELTKGMSMVLVCATSFVLIFIVMVCWIPTPYICLRI